MCGSVISSKAAGSLCPSPPLLSDFACVWPEVYGSKVKTLKVLTLGSHSMISESHESKEQASVATSLAYSSLNHHWASVISLVKWGQ